MNHKQPAAPIGRIVIVGGGASGALVATQLARRATAPLDVTIVEPRPRLARGLAYSTEDPRHLVNVPARGMSALPDVADHFTRWARCPGVAFATRERYGDYLEAVMRVYNLHGRRDNKYKARIKILVHEIGLEAFRAEVEAEYARHPQQTTVVEERELARITRYFAGPALTPQSPFNPGFEQAKRGNPDFARWARNNLAPHRVNGYAIVNVSLKPEGGIPGDATGDQMRVLAYLAERYGHDELRVSHAQNIVLPHVKLDDVFALWQALAAADLATPNLGLVGDIIACPGLDYCALATARSIPVAQAISRKLFAQRSSLGETVGILLVVAGVAVLLLAA